LFKRTALVLLIVFILSQFIRPKKNKGVADTPDDITHSVTVPDTVMNLLRQSCFDCRSNHTNYPWYSKISPMSLWLANHVKKGKAELNFSEFPKDNKRRMKSKLTSIAEQVEKREMPLKSYLIIHRYAKLDDSQIQSIKNWINSTKAQLDSKN
jgi:hypothetical protein